MKFNVVIIDTTCPFPYELNTLSVRGLGGTEATVIRVAEALGSTGLKVAVVQHSAKYALEGKHAYYLPLSYLDQMEDPDHYIMLRGTQFIDRFPRSAKYSWHEDLPNEIMIGMREAFIDHDVTVVAASRWHKNAIQELICHTDQGRNPEVTFIYNPVPDVLYVPKDIEVKYYPTKLVWPASPHKGLEQAIELVERLVEVSGNKDYRLHIFNPGYMVKDIRRSDYVINHGPVPCSQLWQHMSESLCVFYPTQFKETFGCIAAEANAVHCPVLTHEIAALSETVAGHGQFVKQNPKDIIDTVIKWNKGYRPKVYGQERFKLSEVRNQWLRLLQKKKPLTR